MTARARKEVCCCEKVLPKFLSAADLRVPVRADRWCSCSIPSTTPSRARIWHGFTTKWYVELLGDADILHSLYVTLLVAVIAAVLATLLGTVAAIGIHNMRRRTRTAYLTVNNIPMSSSDTIMGVTFMLLFARHRSGQGLSDAHSGARDVLHALRHPQRHAQAAPARQERL